MHIGLGLLIAGYAGIRLYEKVRSTQSKPQSRYVVKESPNSNIKILKKQAPDKTAPKVQEAPSKTAPAKDPWHEFIQQQRKHKHLSALTAVLFLLSRAFPTLHIFSLASMLYTSLPYFREIEATIKQEKKINVDLLFFVANIITLGLGKFMTGSINLWLVYSGYELVGRVKSSTQTMLSQVFDQLPNLVWVVKNGAEIERELAEIVKGDELIVKAGELIPVDGIVISGNAAVDQRALTGEAQPAEKYVGESVFANTIVQSGQLTIRVEKSGEDTVASKIVQALENSINFKSKVQLKGEQWAEKATLPVFLLSIPILFTLGATATVLFIYSHIGYRIRLLAPLATLEHVVESANKSLLVKDGRALETLFKVNTFIFDKTGTLTNDIPEVIEIVPFGNFKKDRILSYAATAENKLSHPIAQAIVKYAKQKDIQVSDIEDAKYQIGFGISVQIGKQHIRVGSTRFLIEEGIEISQRAESVQSQAHNRGNSIVFVSSNNKLCGAIELQAQVREEVPKMLSELKSLGIKHFAILSGDHKEPTRRLAKSLGMDDYYHSVLPEEKANIIQKLQSEGKTVCFMGDGINDAIAMKSAAVSVSLRGASSIATDTADVLLMDGNLKNVHGLVDIAQRLDKELKRRLWLTLIPSGINLATVFYSKFGIMGSILINTGFFFVAARDPMAVFKTQAKSINSQKALERQSHTREDTEIHSLAPEKEQEAVSA